MRPCLVNFLRESMLAKAFDLAAGLSLLRHTACALHAASVAGAALLHMMVRCMLSTSHLSLLGDQLQLGAMPLCFLTNAKLAGAVAKGSGLAEIQPVEAARSGRTAASVPSGPAVASLPGNQPAPGRVVQEADGGKARFVCCGFGGRKAGSRTNRKK